MALTTATISHTGGRERNEDALRWGHDGSADAAAATGWWTVADGLGGHACGEIAAQLAVDAVQRLLEAPDAPDASRAGQLAAAIEAAHRAILAGIAESPSDRAGMGCTLVVAACDATSVAWAHCGDSRFYRFVGDRLVGFTRDHSVAALLSPPDRDERPELARNQLLRVLGVDDVACEYDLHEPVALQPNERWLLCTDGWWELVLESEMERDLADSESPADWLERMERRIDARREPGSDNYTAIAVWRD